MADNFTRLRAQWVDRIMHDARLTPRTRLVGYEVGCHLNRHSGEAWPSQETIRRKLGIRNISQVKRAIADLKARGYLDVLLDPATRSNSYVPKFDGGASATTVVAQAPPYGGSSATIGGGEIEGRWWRNRTIDGGASAPQYSLRDTLDDLTAVSSTSAGGYTDPRWQSVKNRLTISQSPAIVISWFDPMELLTVGEADVVLRSPSAFARKYVENNHLYDRLTDAWRAELGAAVNVRLVDPIARAAE